MYSYTLFCSFFRYVLVLATPYSLISLQVKTMCLPIHVEASLTTTLSYGVLSPVYYPLDSISYNHHPMYQHITLYHLLT